MRLAAKYHVIAVGSGETGAAAWGSGVGNPIAPFEYPDGGPDYLTWCEWGCWAGQCFFTVDCHSEAGGLGGLGSPPPTCGAGSVSIGGECVGGGGAGPAGPPAGPCLPGMVQWGADGCLPEWVNPWSPAPPSFFRRFPPRPAYGGGPYTCKNDAGDDVTCPDCADLCGAEYIYGIQSCNGQKACCCLCSERINHDFPTTASSGDDRINKAARDCITRHERRHLEDAGCASGGPKIPQAERECRAFGTEAICWKGHGESLRGCARDPAL